MGILVHSSSSDKHDIFSRKYLIPYYSLFYSDFIFAALQSTDVEWAVAHGSTETISFARSGIKVKFTDSESYADLSKNLAVEICWNEINFPRLKEGEVLLSPVVRFHPHSQPMNNVCCVKIPHTALLEGTHDLELMLKRGVFEGENCSWEDVSDSLFSVEATEVCLNITKLQSYAVVGRGVAFKKRMQCAVFAGKDIIDDRFTADLCFIDDCEASQEVSGCVKKSPYRKIRLFLSFLLYMYGSILL